MILIIDDDRAGAYVDELKWSGFDVSCEAETDAAVNFFEENYRQIKLLILDIRMPPGESFEHEQTQRGQRTGVFLYERIRQKAPDLPIMILTVLSGSDLENRFCNEKLCWFYQKKDLLPHELVREVTKVVARCANHGGNYDS